MSKVLLAVDADDTSRFVTVVTARSEVALAMAASLEDSGIGQNLCKRLRSTASTPHQIHDDWLSSGISWDDINQDRPHFSAFTYYMRLVSVDVDAILKALANTSLPSTTLVETKPWVL